MRSETFENENLQFQILLKLIGENSTAINQLSKQMEAIITSIDELRTGMKDIKNVIEELKCDIVISPKQVDKIKLLVCKRVCEILGDDEHERNKYYRTFVMQCYSDCRTEVGLGYRISATKKVIIRG